MPWANKNDHELKKNPIYKNMNFEKAQIPSIQRVGQYEMINFQFPFDPTV